MSKEIQESEQDSHTHPLDPLTESEVTTAKEILEQEVTVKDSTRYAKIVLDEPTKDEMVAFEEDGTDPERRAFIRLRDIEEKATYEADVAINAASVLTYDHVEEVQPSITLTEFELCEETVKAHDERQAAV
jgi:primary-amine oxidase